MPPERCLSFGSQIARPPHAEYPRDRPHLVRRLNHARVQLYYVLHTRQRSTALTSIMAQRHQRRHDERRRRRRGRGGAASTTWWLLASAVAIAAVLSCASAQRAGVREAPTVTVRRQGAVSGVEVPLNKIGHRAWMYLGIPFAQPPLGDLRFAPPAVEPPPSWTGVRNGSAHMPSCLQDPPARPSPVYRLFATVAPPLRTSEDCLYLNVYRPEGDITNRYCYYAFTGT